MLCLHSQHTLTIQSCTRRRRRIHNSWTYHVNFYPTFAYRNATTHEQAQHCVLWAVVGGHGAKYYDTIEGDGIYDWATLDAGSVDGRGRWLSIWMSRRFFGREMSIRFPSANVLFGMRAEMKGKLSYTSSINIINLIKCFHTQIRDSAVGEQSRVIGNGIDSAKMLNAFRYHWALLNVLLRCFLDVDRRRDEDGYLIDKKEFCTALFWELICDLLSDSWCDYKLFPWPSRVERGLDWNNLILHHSWMQP